MKIINICITGPFTKGMTYQDNLLAEQMSKDGNDVIIIASSHQFENNKIIAIPEEDIIVNGGVRLIRKRYINIFNEFISGKVRAVKGLYDILEKEQPDIIFHHGLQSYEMLTIKKYKKNNPKVKFYVDSHEDFNNSATNFLSKHILHKIFYKYIIKKTLPYIDRVLCVGYECFGFLSQLYGVPAEKMEFYPLGGIVFDDETREEKRNRKRAELNLHEEDILIVHSGKMDKKKRTEEILRALTKVPSNKLKMIIIGSLAEDVKNNIENLISMDDRINFLGWKDGDELMEYLCASDLYIQPGGQSATMQNALCAGSAAALYPHESHKYLLEDSVYYIETIEDIVNVFKKISENRETLENKRIQSNKIAREILDYKVLASRLYKV